MKVRLFVALVFLITPLTVSAHDGILFEYAPDSWQSHRHAVTSGATPYQLFEMPVTAAISGFDIWLDNTGSSGPITFAVSDSDNTLLATKNVTLAPTPSSAGGTKYHFDLSAPLLLTGSELYALQVSSQLPGLGLYYVDRTTILEHNKNYQTSYSYGAARLGSVEQAFTFKFALHSPDTEAVGEPEPDDEDPEEEPGPTVVSITNARIVSKTATTVTVAWSTNIASNSRVTVRDQLNPLYIVKTVSDPTLELEHVLTATGLAPSTNYFADMYSASSGELILTTYTVSFTTEQGIGVPTPPPPVVPPTPPITPPPVTPPATPPATPPPTPGSPPPAPPAGPPTPPSPPPPPDDPDDEIITIEPSGGGDGLPGLGVGGSGGGNVDFSWDAPPGGEPEGGYRIDIFDHNHNLIDSIFVPAGTHTARIEALRSGKHYAVVYANNDEVYEKIAQPTSFLLQKKSNAVNIVIGMSLVWIAGLGGYMLWKSKKARVVVQEESDTLSA